ncbi:MAG: hypothetical protein IH914_07645 [candidate division Zixibacteria bacterium]|nr:hypothetical protein [candidate division Zixibacteria bacterium]
MLSLSSPLAVASAQQLGDAPPKNSQEMTNCTSAILTFPSLLASPGVEQQLGLVVMVVKAAPVYFSANTG